MVTYILILIDSNYKDNNSLLINEDAALLKGEWSVGVV